MSLRTRSLSLLSLLSLLLHLPLLIHRSHSHSHRGRDMCRRSAVGGMCRCRMSHPHNLSWGQVSVYSCCSLYASVHHRHCVPHILLDQPCSLLKPIKSEPFSSRPSSAALSIPAPPLHTSEEERQRWEKQIREQKELQLLEARIRQAEVAQLTHNKGQNYEGEREDSLYHERLKQYQELAALDDDKYRDSVAEAEANGGVIDGGTWEHR